MLREPMTTAFSDGTKMRSVIKLANRKGIEQVVDQQFEIGKKILAAGLVGMTVPKYRIVRILGALGWAISATWGLKLALALVDMQNNPSPFSTCSFLPEFPAWMPLHEWFPAIMMPTGMCTDVPWQFMGVTMAEWMVVAFSGYLVMLLLFIVPILSGSNKPSLYK